jgi:hypothetical protein
LKNLTINTLFKLLLPLSFWMSGNTVCKAQAINPVVCKIYGSIYYEEDPKKADFKVYVESSEAFADLLVFHSSNRLYADQAGLWYVTEKRDIANFRIFITEQKKNADFSICYISTESFAGCPR